MTRVISAEPTSLSSSSRRRSQRSARVPARGETTSMVTPATKAMKAKRVAEPVFSYIQTPRAKLPRAVPIIETNWPSQRVRKIRIPWDALLLVMSSSLWLKRLGRGAPSR